MSEFDMSKIKFSGKYILAKKLIFKQLMEVGELSTKQIYIHLTQWKRRNLTMNELANILHRCKYFEKIGFEDKTDFYGRSKCLIWGLNYEKF